MDGWLATEGMAAFAFRPVANPLGMNSQSPNLPNFCTGKGVIIPDNCILVSIKAAPCKTKKRIGKTTINVRDRYGFRAVLTPI